MTDSLNRARAALERATTIESAEGNDVSFLVQFAIASALISLAQDVGKIALLLRQRLKK